MNNIWAWLAENPGRVQEIINDPDNINAQVEELLRVFSVTFSGRTVAQDVEMRGVQMKKGDKVTSILPACNYDPEGGDMMRVLIVEDEPRMAALLKQAIEEDAYAVDGVGTENSGLPSCDADNIHVVSCALSPL